MVTKSLSYADHKPEGLTTHAAYGDVLRTKEAPRQEGSEMTDRHAGYIVTLKEDMREDDAAKIISAISMVSGVLDVRPITSDISQTLGQARAEQDFKRKLIDTFFTARSAVPPTV